MKNKSIFKNIGRMSIAIAVLGTALLSSCLKDTSPGTINFATSTTVVGWQYYGFSGNFSQPLGIKVHGTDQDTTSEDHPVNQICNPGFGNYYHCGRRSV